MVAGGDRTTEGKRMIKIIAAFILGIREFRLSFTWADPARSDDDDYTDLDDAYDRGREFAHRITLRHWDK